MPLLILIHASAKDRVKIMHGKAKDRIDNIFSFIPLGMRIEQLKAKLTNKYKAECLTKLSRTSLASPAGEFKCTYVYV